MFSKSNNNSKVKFQDQQLDDYVLENSVLKSKLDSKIAALSIMSKQLDKSNMDRDRYRVLVEQLQSKKSVHFSLQDININRHTQRNEISGGELLAKTREDNNMLKLEVEALKAKLEEATGDIVALRKQLQIVDSYAGHNKLSTVLSCTNTDYEDLVQELEKIHMKYQQLQQDYRATLDEKEEIIQDRDYYKSKVQRLNHQISYVMSNRVKSDSSEDDSDSPKPVVDLDSLVQENKYLHERITQSEVEKEILKRNLSKYKTLLENRNNDSRNLKKGFLDVMTQKQVREYLENNSKTGIKRSSAAELKSLCLGLFEALNDKSIALQHQRKTNQILANRITELEKTLESWCNGQKYIPIFPSQMLIEEYLTEVTSIKSDEAKPSNEQRENKMADMNKCHDSDDEIDHRSKCDDDYLEDKNGDYSNYDTDTDSMKTKTVLPTELQELVREALAELNG